ncbi:ABC transporter ATP-binding protein [Pullulanibacillus sp. KACC 23026]|uniref:ABC transporter ATP-binding protein n=1 Tax=Pullulanibacillus sp. KACC 23026 TaxID=3028315 RepID=UPI0023AEFAE0|nr:ABC transporter ATP-binding protein [Pullulanibacillus sp. KACC 23026]WEG14762.1 ABC transporter ATP-binding protein [Pullulanibacillus sp. KACC 23026]
MKILNTTINHFKPYWKALLIAFVFSLIGGAFTILPSILVGKLVDDVLQKREMAFLIWVVGGVLVAYLGKSLFETLQEFVQVKIGLDVITDMQLRAFRKLHRAPMSFFSNTPRGDLLYRLTHDVESIQNLNNTVIPRIIQQVISAIAAFASVFVLFWPAAIVMFVVFAIYIFPSFKLGKTMRIKSQIQRDMSADMYQHLQESIESVRLVRTYQTQDQELETQATKLSDWKRFSIRAALLGKVNWRLGNLFNIAAPGIVMLIGGIAIWNHHITVGTLVSCLSFITIMFQPVRSLAENALTIQQAIPALRRIYDYFDLPDEHAEGLPEFAQVVGKIDLENIWFTYPNSDKQILKGVSLSLKPGQHIGIVGTSGGGKSTLVQILLGLYEPQQGSVHIDDQDLFAYNRNSFRQQVGVVSQETFLLNSTLRQNLLYGKADASAEELDRAVEAAGLKELIDSLEDNYETVVGERGLKLSGGQRQRVALARAILRQPPVLIFDEATSSLDGETEERVQASLEQLIPGRTTITIAHRLVTVRKADVIILLDNGMVAEKGTHEELLSLKGHYYHLYKAQYTELEKELMA